MYTKKLMNYFMNPKHAKKLEDFDGKGIAGNLQCGDLMTIFIKIEKNKNGEEFIKNISFLTLGCAAAISSSEALCRLVKGKKIKQALKIKDVDIVKKLGELPTIKLHCSLLAVKALREAIYNYLSKNNLAIPKGLESLHKKNKKELIIAKKKHGKE